LEDLQQLIRDCKRQDRKSQEKLYKQFYVPLYCLCRRIFQNEHEAIESVNDGMLKVFSSIGSYREDKGRFFNWVYTIVRNTALDKLRTTVSFAEHIDLLTDLPETDAGDNPLKALEWKEMYVLLDQLNPATRAVCSLFYMEGYSIKDIAEQLDISSGTVKWHLSESRKKMKIILERYFT
jgi:RNA polymerase sigma factor (sigma-70 family)